MISTLVWLGTFAALAFGLGGSVATWIEHSRQVPFFCAAGGCESVLASDYANPLGIPLPLVGTFAFAFQIVWLARLAGSAVEPTPDEPEQTTKPFSATGFQAATILMAAGAVGLIGIQVQVLGTICQLCMIVDVSAISTAALALHLKPLPNGRASWLRIAAAVMTIAAIGVPLVAAWRTPVPVPPPVVQSRAPDQNVVVIISSFTCAGCRYSHGDIEAAINETMNETAGPSITVHRRWMTFNDDGPAELAARSFIAADRLGHGPALERFLFTAPTIDRTTVINEATRLGMDATEFETQMDAPAIAETLRTHRGEFDNSHLTGIPSVWVNDQLFTAPSAMNAAADAIRALGQSRLEN